jgi:hypothetical protein
MSLRGNAIRANTLDSISSTMAIGAGCASISVGTATSKTNLGSLVSYATVRSAVYNTDLQTNTITIADLQNFQYFVSGFSTNNPATSNETITFNLPTPTVDIEGIIYTFRKIRGGISNSGTNFTFNFASASYVANNLGLTSSGQPAAVFNTGALFTRFTVVEYLGSYYWIQS